MFAALMRLHSSPVLARVFPFAIFVLLTALQGKLGESSRYWIYGLKTISGAWMLWTLRSTIPEMRWRFSWEAVMVGVVIFGIWIGLDPFYAKIGKPESEWNPFASFPTNPSLAWSVVVVRFFAVTLVVPPLEEVFYRSFAYRFVIRQDFQSVPFNEFKWVPFLATSAVFGLAHHEWLAGFLCGLAYQGLVIRKNRLGDAMTAHAITNFLLGLWVVGKGQWQFW